MNLRLGFARLGKVAAGAYWLLAGGVVAAYVFTACDQREKALHPADYVVSVQDGRTFRVRSADQWEAQEAANDYAVQHPLMNPGAETSATPIRLSLPDYENPPGLEIIALKAGLLLVALTVANPAIRGLFRATHWVVQGFLTPPPQPRKPPPAPARVPRPGWK
jgi:hypothetical protein